MKVLNVRTRGITYYPPVNKLMMQKCQQLLSRSHLFDAEQTCFKFIVMNSMMIFPRIPEFHWPLTVQLTNDNFLLRI